MSKYDVLALEEAIKDQDVIEIDEILKRLETKFRDVVRKEDEDIVRRLWRNAARWGTPELIQKLAKQFTVKISNNDSVAIAMRRDRNADVVHALVEIGMDVNINLSEIYRKKGGFECKSALREAAKRGNLKMVKFIVQKVKEKEPKEPLQDVEHSFIRACRHGRMDVVKYFLEEMDESPNIDCRDTKHGSTALMFAAQRGHLEIVKYLVSKGADIFLINPTSKKNALDFARTGIVSKMKDYIVTYLENALQNAEKTFQAHQQKVEKEQQMKDGITKMLTTTSGEKILLFLDDSLEIKAFSVTHTKVLPISE
jgi:hypothetical protein